MRKVFPDHWSFMLGEIALWSFVILLLTGTYLALFFNPSMAPVVYHGSYTKLDGITMSQAYQSTLNISFDIRGGLLVRQIHHWAAIMFMIAIMAHMLRVFFTGAYRKPREDNWLIGIVLFTLALIEVAAFSRYMRSSAIDVLAQDYIKVARAKGLPERLVLMRHLAKNASLPMVTLIGLSLPILLAGNLIIETLFNYQGLGLLFFTSLNKVDYPVLLAYTLAGAVLVVVGNLIADIALTVADPRIRLA